MTIKNLLFGTLYSAITCACYFSGDELAEFLGLIYALFAVDAIFCGEAVSDSMNKTIRHILGVVEK